MSSHPLLDKIKHETFDRSAPVPAIKSLGCDDRPVPKPLGRTFESHLEGRELARFKSNLVLSLMQYNFIAFSLLAASIFYFLFYRLFPSGVIDSNVVFNADSILALLLLVPSQWMRWFSAFVGLLPLRPGQYKGKPVVRSFKRLLICVVTKGDNVDAVERTVSSMKYASNIDSRISFHIVTEEDKVRILSSRLSGYTRVSVCSIPLTFQCLHAMYKARALEWFRLHLQVTADDWVLHLDEETVVDEHGLRACIDTIERGGKIDFAQGIILYNHHNYWKNSLLTLADVSRVLDDIGRYQWQANYMHRPIFGVHGSFFLCNGAVENAVTWDTDNLVEDYWFSLQASKMGFRLGWIPGIAREQSPQGILDLIKQRRRWYRGIWSLHTPMGYAAIMAWSWPAFSPCICVVYSLAIGIHTSMPLWLYGVLAFDRALEMCSLGLALFIQDVDAGIPWRNMLWNQFFLIVASPCVRLLESTAILSAMLEAPNGFEVIAK